MSEFCITIVVPDSFVLEREYIADVIFRQFLSIPYKIEPDPSLNVSSQIRIQGKTIILKDDFFPERMN